MYIDMGVTPMQYIKRTVRQSDYYGVSSVVNPMNVGLSSDLTTIAPLSSDSTVYGSALDNKVIKESYTSYINTGVSPSDSVSVSGVASTWSSIVYATALPYSYNSQNYELQQIASTGGFDYSSNVQLFKNFQIDKYYQYNKTISANLVGKIAATATVFNPLNISGQGGETTRTIVWDFFSYSISGLETYKYRVITNGQSSETALLSSTGIFPSVLITI